MRFVYLLGLLLSLSILSGCVDRIDIEDISLSLLIGVDVDKDNHLIITSSSPVFHKEAVEKEETTIVKATTFRESREQLDATINAYTSRGKVQVILISKRIFLHPDWFNIMDTIYRDGRNTTMSRVVLVDGPISDISTFIPKDKPRLPIYLVNLIDSSYERSLIVKTTPRELHRQFSEKGMTPRITELKKDGQIAVTGTALLNRNGTYKLSLNTDQTKLLRILSQETDGLFPFTIHLPEQPDEDLSQGNTLSFFPNAIHVKTKTHFTDNKFVFDIGVNMRIVLTERLFKYDIRNNAPELERQVENELEKQFNQLVKKIQGAQIDPIGLGMYARAYTYPHWKKVQNNWGEAFANADVNVKVNIKILAMGSIH